MQHLCNDFGSRGVAALMLLVHSRHVADRRSGAQIGARAGRLGALLSAQSVDLIVHAGMLVPREMQDGRDFPLARLQRQRDIGLGSRWATAPAVQCATSTAAARSN
jgi:hypothetical protein